MHLGLHGATGVRRHAESRWLRLELGRQY